MKTVVRTFPAKKIYFLLLLTVITVSGLKLIDENYNKTVYVSTNSKKGVKFWKDIGAHLLEKTTDTLPANLPGPLDGWAGEGPKELIIKSPYNRTLEFTLNLYESHDERPPLLEVRVNDTRVGNIHVKPGGGAKDDMWRITGVRSSYTLTIDGALLADKASTISVRSINGSWIAINNIIIRPEPRSWEVWGHLSARLAYRLLVGSVFLLIFSVLWHIQVNHLWGELAKNSLLFFVSTIACLAFIELIMRNYIPQPLLETSLKMVYIPDDKIGYRLKPNVKTAVGFNTNSLGMRDYDRYSKRKPKNRFRILCIGDSFTYSITKMENSYPKYLELLLNEKYENVEVLNAGGSGYGTKEEYAYMEAYGLDFEPDLIILGFFVGNDITDSRPTRHMTAVDGVLMDKEQAARISADTVSWEKRKKQFLNDIHLYRFVKNRDYKELFIYYDDNLTKTLKRKSVRSGKCLSVDTRGQYKNPDDYEKHVKESWDNTVVHLGKITQLAKMKGVELGIALIPSEIQFSHPEADSIKKEMKKLVKFETYDWLYPQKSLMELADKNDWPMFDTIDAMKAQGSGDSYYFCRDPHFNKNGNRVFALAVKEWIVKNYGYLITRVISGVAKASANP